jgi:tRNA A37 threonylcarbamoyladenosine synthetase subunit TsaC/SUA5/YrdC
MKEIGVPLITSSANISGEEALIIKLKQAVNNRW